MSCTFKGLTVVTSTETDHAVLRVGNNSPHPALRAAMRTEMPWSDTQYAGCKWGYTGGVSHACGSSARCPAPATSRSPR